MATHTWPSKDPDEVLDYQHNWNPRLGADVVVGPPLATVEEGDVVVDSTTILAGVQTVWLSRGTNGTKCKIVLQLQTAAPRIMQEGVKITIKAK